MNANVRIEKDALGEVRVPADHLWGAQTQRSVENFPIGVDRFKWGRPVIRAFGVLKKSAAIANGELGELPGEKVDLIVRAAQEVIDGKLDAEFPLWCSRRVGDAVEHERQRGDREPCDPARGRRRRLEEADPSQRRRQPRAVVQRHVPGGDAHRHARRAGASPDARLEALSETLEGKARAFDDVVMIGRTHLMDADAGDARPDHLRVGRAQLEDAQAALACAREQLFRWRSAAPRSARASTRIRASATPRRRPSRSETGRAFVSGRNKFALLLGARRDRQRQRRAAHARRALMKIANDVRWHASGPRAGLGEISIPTTSPARRSCRARATRRSASADDGVRARLRQRTAAVASAGSQGNFQLNVYKPVMLHGCPESIALLADAMLSFDERCARGIEPLRHAIRENVERSLMLVTGAQPAHRLRERREDRADRPPRRHQPARSRAEAEARQRGGLRPVGAAGGDDAAGQRLAPRPEGLAQARSASGLGRIPRAPCALSTTC
jgi:fumarate hydratase class II